MTPAKGQGRPYVFGVPLDADQLRLLKCGAQVCGKTSRDEDLTLLVVADEVVALCRYHRQAREARQLRIIPRERDGTPFWDPP